MSFSTRPVARSVRALIVLAALAGLPWTARADFNAAAQYALGNPSNATSSVKSEENYLISRSTYALGYNRYEGIARWVSWHLNASDVGSASRGSYRTDTTLPSGWYEVKSTESPSWSSEPAPYGPYDRGHQCPSGDRTANDTVNDEVFWMTNLFPQASDNNQGPWEKLESYSRTLAAGGNELYILCGGHGFTKRISTGHVTVPTWTWKIIVVLPDRSGDDLARIDAATRVIAVDMPNVAGIRTADWKTYRVSVASIEAKTGLRFFTNLPVRVQNALKAKVDTM